MARRILGRFTRNEDGATIVEYGVIVALMAAALLGGAFAIGQAVNGQLNEAAGEFPPAD